jgi:putative heme-binding domain-containing protein
MSRHAPALDRLMKMARSDEPPARRQAATALGQIGDVRAAPALMEAAAKQDDRFLEHAIIYSLIQLKPAAALLSGLSNPSSAVRKAALIALDQMDSSPLEQKHVLAFLGDSDPTLRRAGLWVASRRPAWSGGLAQSIEARLRAPRFSEGETEMIREALMALGSSSAELRQVIGRALGDPRLAADRQLLLLQAAIEGPWKQWPPEWNEGLRKSLAHPDHRVRLEAINLARARGVASVDPELARLSSSEESQPDEVRIAALSALGARRPELDDAAFHYLLTQLGPRVDAPRKLAAAQVLSRARLSDTQLKELARDHLGNADALVLPNLLEAYRGSHDPAVGAGLVKALDAIESSLGTVGSQRVREAVGRFPADVQRAAAPLLARIEEGRRSRMDKLRRLEPAIQASGSRQRGREIFFGAKAGCSSCHTIGSEGGHVGPDLTSIGAIRAPHDILEAIVLPSESFVPGHEVYRVETARDVYSGVLKSRTEEAVLLITGPGDEVRVPRKEIVKMGHAPVSLMPEGFDEVLTPEEMADLLAFLRAQTSRGAAIEQAGAGGGE